MATSGTKPPVRIVTGDCSLAKTWMKKYMYVYNEQEKAASEAEKKTLIGKAYPKGEVPQTACQDTKDCFDKLVAVLEEDKEKYSIMKATALANFSSQQLEACYVTIEGIRMNLNRLLDDLILVSDDILTRVRDRRTKFTEDLPEMKAILETKESLGKAHRNHRGFNVRTVDQVMFLHNAGKFVDNMLNSNPFPKLLASGRQTRQERGRLPTLATNNRSDASGAPTIPTSARLQLGSKTTPPYSLANKPGQAGFEQLASESVRSMGTGQCQQISRHPKSGPLLPESVSQTPQKQGGPRGGSTSPSGAPPGKRVKNNVDASVSALLPAWIGACLGEAHGGVAFTLPRESQPLVAEAQKWYTQLTEAAVYFSKPTEEHRNPMLNEKYADLKQACDSLRAKAQVILQGCKDAGFDQLGPLANLSEDQKKKYDTLREVYAELRASCEQLTVAISKIYKLCKVFGCGCRSQPDRADAKWHQAIPSFQSATPRTSSTRHVWSVELLKRQVDSRQFRITYAYSSRAE
jgi:hypothetical protein